MLEYEANFSFFIFYQTSAYGKVIHINDKPTFSDVVGKVIVHKGLEGWGRSAEAEEHYCWFKQSQLSDKYSLPFISFFDANIVIPPTDIELGEVGELSQVVDEISDEGEGVGVFDSVVI